MSQNQAVTVPPRNTPYTISRLPDNPSVRPEMQHFESTKDATLLWALQLCAISAQDPHRLIHSLTGAILGCGGRMLSRGADERGTVNLFFEFERQACMDVYSVLMASGVELSRASHVDLTELCRCTRNHRREFATDIASVDLEIRTFPIDAICCAPVPGIV